MKEKAIIVITCDDVNDYFLVIDLKTGKEIGRTNTESMGTWRYDDDYDEEKTVEKVASTFGVENYTIIRWY